MVTKEDLNKRKTRIDNLIHALSLLISIEYNDKNLRYKHVFVNVMGQEVYMVL